MKILFTNKDHLPILTYRQPVMTPWGEEETAQVEKMFEFTDVQIILTYEKTPSGGGWSKHAAIPNPKAEPSQIFSKGLLFIPEDDHGYHTLRLLLPDIECVETVIYVCTSYSDAYADKSHLEKLHEKYGAEKLFIVACIPCLGYDYDKVECLRKWAKKIHCNFNTMYGGTPEAPNKGSVLNKRLGDLLYNDLVKNLKFKQGKR